MKIEVVKMLKRGSARELAELLGISERRVNQLVNEEVLHREIGKNIFKSKPFSGLERPSNKVIHRKNL